jgi:hypothetical protein
LKGFYFVPRIYETNNLGRINADTPKQFYLKDHLGSVRWAIKTKSEIISAQDFDAWGYKMEGRKFSADESKYKFTGKERDTEVTLAGRENDNSVKVSMTGEAYETKIPFAHIDYQFDFKVTQNEMEKFLLTDQELIINFLLSKFILRILQLVRGHNFYTIFARIVCGILSICLTNFPVIIKK